MLKLREHPQPRRHGYAAREVRRWALGQERTMGLDSRSFGFFIAVLLEGGKTNSPQVDTRKLHGYDELDARHLTAKLEKAGLVEVAA